MEAARHNKIVGDTVVSKKGVMRDGVELALLLRYCKDTSGWDLVVRGVARGFTQYYLTTVSPRNVVGGRAEAQKKLEVWFPIRSEGVRIGANAIVETN